MTKKLTFIKAIIITFLLLNVYSVVAQKPVLTDEEVVIETVTKEIDDVFVSKEFLNKKNKNLLILKEPWWSISVLFKTEKFPPFSK
jgi:hypothetical protein